MLRMKMWLTAAAAAVWSASVPAQGATLEQDAIDFGKLETARSIDLSPDGTKIVYVGPGPGSTQLAYVADLANGQSKPILRTTDIADKLRWCAFVANTRLICQYAANRPFDQTVIGVRRTVALNTDGSGVQQIGNVNAMQSDGMVIDWLPGDDRHVLMIRGGSVERVDTQTLKGNQVETLRTPGLVLTDGHGHVRLMGIAQMVTDGTYSTGKFKYNYRTADSRDWKPLTESYVDAEDFEPLAIDSATNSAYVKRRVDGRAVIDVIKLDGTLQTKRLAANAKVDVDGVVTVGEDRRVIGYSFAEEKRSIVYLDPKYDKLAALLSKALPNLPSVSFVAASSNENKLIFNASSDRDPGHYYLFDTAKKSLAEIFAERPQLAGRVLAEMKPVTYKAADGTDIPAYLTLPPGKGATGLPAVVMPHGGPSSRDEWGFDWIVQFLASRGYAVIQPNYRGSAGYGQKWLNENGFKGWRTSIGDVNDAARYLASSGIADPKRIAILGWSYGGYAALQAAETQPGLYKAVVAVAPVTDLALVKEESRYFSNMKQVAEEIGSGPHVAEGSPINGAARIEAPVLLAHGDLDINVGIRHSDRMEAALKRSGKNVEYIRMKGLDHQLADSTARATMLLKIGQLLERTIGH